MPTRRDVLLGSAALLSGAYAGARAQDKAKPRPLGEVQDEVRKLVPEAMSRYGYLAGLSLALVRDHEIVWKEAFGVRDRETQEELTPDTVIEAASLAKPAFAYAVLGLVEEGKLSLDKPLLEYLGRDLDPDEPRFKQVTARHVLTHTSGIEPGPGADRPSKLEFTPGERFKYSPHGFDVLQKSVEHATGETLTPLLERFVFKPFGMAHSAADWSKEYAESGARGYDKNGKQQQTFNEKVWRMSAEERAKFLAPYPLESVPNAAAGLNCTPADYAKFLIGVMRASSESSPSKKMVDEMLKPHVCVDPVKFKDLHWGMGFGVQCPPSEPLSFWHTGDWGFFAHFAVAYRDEGTAMVVMTNGAGMKACRDVIERALGRKLLALAWYLG